MAPIDVPSWTQLDMDAVCARIRLTTLLPVAVITGGRYGLVISQILDVLDAHADRSHLHLMPTSGTRYYRWDGDDWRCVYAHDLGADLRDAAVASLTDHAKELGLWLEDTWGPRIEDRGVGAAGAGRDPRTVGSGWY